MNKSAKILLVYSTVASGLIITSGFFFNQNLQNWLLQIVFAPVPIFLLYTVITRSTDVKISKKQLIFAAVIMAALFSIGFSNVQKSQAADALDSEQDDTNQEENITLFSINNVEISEEDNDAKGFIIVEITAYDVTFVNVRKEPRAASLKLTVVQSGDRFKSTGHEGQWYEVLLDDDTKGYVFEEFVTEIDEVKE